MKILNKYNLPDRIVRQLSPPHRPVSGRISVTQLIDAPRIRTLLLEKWDDVVLDYSDFLSTVIGLSVHERQERLVDVEEDEEAEVKFEDMIDGVLIVGKSDTYYPKEKIIRDTKVKAVGCFKYVSFKTDLERQLNTYAMQYRSRGYEVSGLECDVYYRDWKKWEADRDKETWAVMKPGRKTAIKVFDREANAIYYVQNNGFSYYVEHRGKGSYPQIPVDYSIPVELWEYNKETEYVKDQIEYHILAPLDCPEECRWKDCLRCKDYCRVRSVCQNSPSYRENTND